MKRGEKIEQFQVQKRQIHYEPEPEMKFFDVDEDTEEVEFTRINDLLRAETSEKVPETSASQGKPTSKKAAVCQGACWFTLFPGRQDLFIDSRLSRMLHRTLLLTACRLEKPIEKIRIRPQFIQWLMELQPEDDQEAVIREFRDALELQAQNLLSANLNGLFLSDTCIVQPAGKELGVNETALAATRYQEGQE